VKEGTDGKDDKSYLDFGYPELWKNSLCVFAAAEKPDARICLCIAWERPKGKTR
jgi:hypothetical protein